MTHPRRPHALAAILGLLCASAWTLFPAASPAADDRLFDGVFARFNTPAPPPYRALRRMEAGLVKSSATRGWIETWTEYRPDGGLRFEIVREGGHEYIRNKVLRRMLINERDLLADGKPLRAPLVPRNYAFEDGGVTEAGLQRVWLKPVRKSDGIIDGALLVAPEAQRIVGMQGRLVKSPSFWVRDVDVTWTFGSIADHIVPLETDAAARVRFYGQAYFKMTYDYASVEGRSTTGATITREQKH